MAVNPQLGGDGVPVPFIGEFFVLSRGSMEFQADKIAELNGGKVSTKGAIYLSNIRLVFVASKPQGNFGAFDMPLRYIHEESFNQPIFGCNNISGKVHPVIPPGSHAALYSPHSFKLLFKNGGCGTFVPLFFALLKEVRQYEQMANRGTEQVQAQIDLLISSPPPADHLIRNAYMDPNDPTKIYLQQPHDSQSQLRRRNYSATTDEQAHY